MFFSKGNLNNSTRRFHVKYRACRGSKTLSDSVLMSSAFKIFQQVYLPTTSVDTEAVVNETLHISLHRVQSKNWLRSEATEPILQRYRRERRRDDNSRIFTQLTARISSRQQSAAGSEDLPVSEPRVQIPAKHYVSSFASNHLWNLLFTPPPTRSYEPPLFTAVEFTRLSGPLRPLVPEPDSPEYSSPKQNLDPQTCSGNSKLLKSLAEGNGDIPSAGCVSRFKRNLVTCKFDKLGGVSGTLCPWQISYSTTLGFWSTQTDFLLKQQVKDYSTYRVRQSLDSSPIAESHSQIIYESTDPMHTATVLVDIGHGITPSTESDQMEYGGNSAHLDRFGILTSLLRLFDSEGRREMQSNSILSENGLSSQITICGIAEDLKHIRTQLFQTSLLYGQMQSKIKPHVLPQPENPMRAANDEMRESAPIRFDGMLTLLLTLSLNSYLWMKTKSQNSYAAESFIQTNAYQTPETKQQLIVPTPVDMSPKANPRVMTINESLIYEVEWQTPSLWMLMSFSPSLDAAQWDVDSTINPIGGTILLDAEYPVEPSTGLQTLTWTTLGPKLHENIGYLLKVSASLELVNVVYKNFQHLEKRVLQSVKALIMDNLSSFSPPLKKILLRGAKRIGSSGLIFDYQLYFAPDRENICHSVQIQMNKLLNKSVTNLRNGNVYLVSILVGDVDECKSEIGACGKETKCLNTIGSYFCQCENGLEGRSMRHSRVCTDPVELDSGFWPSFGLYEVLVGSALCAFLLTAVTLTLCCVMFKRSHTKYFRACDTIPGGPSERTSPEESESEESLFIIPRKSPSYVSFSKFQPIPEEPNRREIDF
ncbi:uncharacterized protein LOC144689449 [Cetorhinus maximus]